MDLIYNLTLGEQCSSRTEFGVPINGNKSVTVVILNSLGSQESISKTYVSS